MRAQYVGYQTWEANENSLEVKLLNVLRELAVVFVGILFLMCASFLEKHNETYSFETLRSFVSDVARGKYDDLSELPKGISVRSLQKNGFHHYNLEVSSGNYTFKGVIRDGAYSASDAISYERNKTAFWEPEVVLQFFGILCVCLGLIWFATKRSLGIKSLREIRRESFYFGQRW